MLPISQDSPFEELFELLPFSVYIIDVNTYQIIYTNEQMRREMGRDDLVGGTCYNYIFNYSQPCPYCKIEQLVENNEPNDQTITYELFDEAKDSWYHVLEKALVWIDGRIVKYSIAFEIDQLKDTQNKLAEAHAQLSIKNKELEELSITDSLTGLYNRLRLYEMMEQELKRSQRYKRPFSIIILDIDDFKQINDTRGHLIGDNILQEMGPLLKENTRETDYAFRWGGEEFLILCPETDAAGIKKLSEDIRQTVAEYDFEQEIGLTVSLGTTTITDNDSYELIISRADKAMYTSKHLGKNTSTHLEQAGDGR